MLLAFGVCFFLILLAELQEVSLSHPFDAILNHGETAGDLLRRVADAFQDLPELLQATRQAIFFFLFFPGALCLCLFMRNAITFCLRRIFAGLLKIVFFLLLLLRLAILFVLLPNLLVLLINLFLLE